MHHRPHPARSMFRRVTAWFAALVAATVVTSTLTAGSSFAVDPIDGTATSSAGYGYFNGETQILAIHDSHADGKGVAIMYYRYDLANTGPYYAWNREGNGTTTYLVLHMPGNARIKFYACPEDGGLIFNYECGARVFVTIPI